MCYNNVTTPHKHPIDIYSAICVGRVIMNKIEFNPDGSIKLPDRMINKRKQEDEVFESRPAIRITRDQVSYVTPLKCELSIEASPLLGNPQRIKALFEYAEERFRHEANLSITKEHEKKYVITIISGKFRCTWCQTFRNYLQNSLDCRMIQKGSCSR